MTVRDISIESPASLRSVAPRRIFAIRTLEQSLLVIVCAMTWSAPISSCLAINLFRVAVILWLLLAWDQHRIRPASRIVVPWIVFFGITAIASIASSDPYTSWQEMKIVGFGFAAILLPDVLRSLRALKILFAGLLVTSAFAALYGVSQSHAGVLERAHGFYNHYINFGEMLLLVALLSLGIFLASLPCARRVLNLAVAFAFAAVAFALAATGTRTFLAALLFGCAVRVWVQFGWRVRALFAAVVIVALFVGGWWFQSRRNLSWFDMKDPGTQYRFLVWRDGARIIAKHPLLGVGFANVQRHPERFDMTAYRAFPNMISHFHSTPIEIAVDCGIPALGIWAWLMVTCWFEVKHAFERAKDFGCFANGAALGLLGAVAAFQVASLFHYILGDPEPMLMFWVFMGSAIALSRRNQRLLQGEGARE